MSHVFPSDATVANQGMDLGFSGLQNAGAVSRRLALALIVGLSTAGWVAVAAVVHQLIA